jgi:hypothetical protein
MAPVSAFTPNAATRGGVHRAGASPQLASVSPMPRPRQGQAGVARQIKEQRRGYARAVLQGLARTYRGRPASQIQKVLQQSLGPLGVRLSPLQAREIAEHITAGRPVELP